MIFREGETVEMIEGVRRRMVSCGERSQMIRFELDEGAKLPHHSHPHEQIGYLVKGRLLLRIGDEEYELKEGEGYSVEPDVEHSVEVLDDSVALDVFAPPREEYR
ncbi:MAG: cupin domain-containing protein [Methanomassiliicoccales archaeon]